jgi:hypothetical protein
MADSNRTEMALAMVDGDCNVNGRWQRRWQWAMGNCDGNGDGDGNGNGNRGGVGDGNGDGNGNGNGNHHGKGDHYKEGLPLHVAKMCSAFGGATPCLHPHGHKGKCIHQRCIMGVTLLRVFAPLKGGGAPDSSPWIVFCLFFTTTVQFTEQLSVCPQHYSGAQEPCQRIDALPPPFLQEPRQPIDDLPQLLLHFLSR